MKADQNYFVSFAIFVVNEHLSLERNRFIEGLAYVK